MEPLLNKSIARAKFIRNNPFEASLLKASSRAERPKKGSV